MSVSSVVNPMHFERQGQKVLLNIGAAKVGATAGWAVNAADDKSLATLPASQTASTLVIPVSGIKPGSVITGFYLLGQIESGGNAVTVDADLRRHRVAAADVEDASVGTITQISKTADSVIDESNSEKDGLAESVAVENSYYILVTGTTGASADIALMGAVVEFTEH